MTLRRRAQLGLRARTSVAFGGVSLLVATTLALFTFERVKGELVEARTAAAEREAFANARVARARLSAGRPPAEVVESLVGREGAALLRADGRWFASTVGIDDGDLPAALRELVADGGAGQQRALLLGSLHLVSGVPVAAQSVEYFEIVVIEDLNRTLDDLRDTLAVGAVGAGGLGAALGAAASGRVLRPLRDVGRAARSIRRGDLRTVLDRRADPDLDTIVDEFNAMVGDLRERIERDERFASNVTHELRGPLAALSAAVDVAERHTDDPARRRDGFESLRRTVAGFNRLVTDLLEISRIEAGVSKLRPEPSDLRELTAAAASAAGVALEPTVDPDVPVPVEVDRLRLGQVLINVLQNADRYGGGACALHVTTGGSPHAVRILVDDAGPGVPAHERSAIFERFHRGAGSDGVAGSTGLGLALAAEHVGLHGGRIWVEDRPGGGARFVVEIPTGGSPR